MRRYQDRTSPSPSPLKKTSITPNRRQLSGKLMGAPSPSTSDNDEDEETLQLRLQALEAKLKLKQLRAKKERNAANGSDVENQHPENLKKSSRSAPASEGEDKSQARLGQVPRQSSTRPPVQVPVSPPRKAANKELPKSPGRVLLGIDKGLSSKNVSLKKKPPVRNPSHVSDDPFLEEALGSRTPQKSSAQHGASLSHQASASKPMSFSERIADIRQQDKDKQQKARILQSQRSTGFGIGIEALESMKAATEEEAKDRAAPMERASTKPAFSRDEVLKAAQKQERRGSRQAGIQGPDKPARKSGKEFSNPNAPPEFTKPTKPVAKQKSQSPPSGAVQSATTPKPTPTDASLFEPFSSLHLSKRLIPHDSLTKALTGKSILLLPDLLATVKAPDYALPDDLEADYVVLATIASKSSPLAHKDRHKSSDTTGPSNEDTTSTTQASESSANVRGKFLALTLTDLKWSLDLYLFSTAYTRWWKLTPGTVIAILNPSIMPPPPNNPHSNRWSLSLHSNDDTILEVGKSRDLGWCKSVKRDGKECGQWVDKRHTEVCEWHVERVVEKTRRGRMEVNGMSVPFGPGGKTRAKNGWGGGGSKGSAPKSSEWYGGNENQSAGGRGLSHDGKHYDRFNKTTFFVGGPTHRSAAALLDATGDNLMDRAGREERVRKRMAERERERDIARQLGEKGKGMGGEYLSRVVPNDSHNNGNNHKHLGRVDNGEGDAEQELVMDATTLGLKGNRAVDVHLSPVKKKRIGGTGTLEGGPTRKKTRFLTEGGIKVAGRESFGLPQGQAQAQGEEDGDELDIV